MKNKIRNSVIGAICVALVSIGVIGTGGGCSSQTVGTNAPAMRFDVVKASNALEVVVETAVQVVAVKETNSPQYFAAGLLALDTLLVSDSVDPQTVRETLAALIPGDANDEIWLAVTAGLNLYRVYAGDVVNQQLDKVKYLKPLLIAMRQGIQGGLTGRVPIPKPAESR